MKVHGPDRGEESRDQASALPAHAAADAGEEG